MKTGIGFRHCILGCIFGIGVFVGLCFLAGIKPLEKIVEFLMFPGALLSNTLGLGRDDIQGVMLYLGGDAVFYALVFVIIFRMVLGPVSKSNTRRSGSLPHG